MTSPPFDVELATPWGRVCLCHEPTYDCACVPWERAEETCIAIRRVLDAFPGSRLLSRRAADAEAEADWERRARETPLGRILLRDRDRRAAEGGR